MAVSRNLVSGNTTMLLLQMLSQKDMYGYEMIETLSERSNNVFELKVGTLYPLLHSLVQSGYLTCYEEEVTVRDVADRYGYEPIRYFMLTAGYRMPLNYTVELIESCKNSLERLYTCRENLDFALVHIIRILFSFFVTFYNF